jgi:WD40 repeat protein
MSSDLRTSCPHCGRETAVSDTLFGSTVRCPSCFREFAFESVSFANGVGEAGERVRREIGERVPMPASSLPRSLVTLPRASIPSKPTPALGTIGRFELRERVGQGSFGVVFRAYDPVLDREVAVKVPQAAFADERTTRRFLAEAKAAARLRHPGIVAVHEAGLAAGRPYLATAFVKGQTLADRLKAGRPPIDVAVSWVRDLARALAYAHSEGVVHRDVKPGNVMLDVHDRPQLMDFGLARHVDSDSSLTAEGALLGTPSYMSPEQARGEAAVGPKSDQYALGAVLYELLCGAKPFTGPPHTVVNQVASAEDPPPLRSRDASLPRDLESICRKAMEKDPARRYDDAAAFADDLSRWLAGDETIARPLGQFERVKRWTRRSPAVASLAAAVVVTALIGFLAVVQQWRQAEANRATALRHLADSRQRQKENAELLLEVRRERDAARRAQEVAERERANAELARNVAEQRRKELETALAEATRQRSRADEAGAEASRLSQQVVGEQEEADRQRAEAARLAARREAERAQELAESDNVAAGLLTAAKALAALPADSDDLEWHLRMNLALLQKGLHEPVGMMEVGRPIRALDIDPTGLLVATGDEAGNVKIWSAERGAEALPPRNYNGAIHAVRFSPDGKQLLICAGKETAELVTIGDNAATPRSLRHPTEVLAAAYDAEGRKIATGGEDRLARVWTAAAARLTYSPLEHEGPVRAVALNPDGKLLLTGTGSLVRRVTLWDAEAGRQLAVLHDGAADVTSVAFSQDGQLMAAGTTDGIVRFWRTADRAPSRQSLKVDSPIRSLTFTPAGRLLVATDSGAARLWNVDDGKSDGQPLAHLGAVTAIACDRSGQGLLTGGEDGVVRLWRYAGTKYTEGPIPHETAVSRVALRPDGEVLATGDVAGNVRLFDLLEGTPIGEPVTLADAVTALSFHPGGGVVACAGADGTARLLSAETGKPVGQRMRHDGPVASLAFSPDGTRLLTVEKDGPVRLWEGETGKSIGKPFTVDGGVQVAKFGPDDSRIATGGQRALRFWSAKGEPMSEPLGIAGRIVSLAFSPDGRSVLAGTEAGEVTRWDVEMGRQLAPAFSHGRPLHTVAFGPDGRLALTAGADRDVRLWDTATGESFGPPLTHGDDVTMARFRGDGRFLVTGTKAGDASFWDAVLGRRLGLPLRAPGPVADLAASEDDTVVAVATGGKAAQVWKVPLPVMTAKEQVVAWAELVTGETIETGDALPLDPQGWNKRRERMRADDE